MQSELGNYFGIGEFARLIFCGGVGRGRVIRGVHLTTVKKSAINQTPTKTSVRLAVFYIGAVPTSPPIFKIFLYVLHVQLLKSSKSPCHFDTFRSAPVPLESHGPKYSSAKYEPRTCHRSKVMNQLTTLLMCHSTALNASVRIFMRFRFRPSEESCESQKSQKPTV